MSRRQFEKIVNEQLEALPLSSEPEVRGKFDQIAEVRKELQAAKERVAELEMHLRQAVEEYNFALGVALRKRLPQVAVNFDNGRCIANYKSTVLSCWPNIDMGLWTFEPNKHGKSFTRRNGPALRLGNQLDPIVDAIVNYLTGRYRTLG